MESKHEQKMQNYTSIRCSDGQNKNTFQIEHLYFIIKNYYNIFL